MRFIYDFLIQAYRFLILIASIWNPKARAWIDGRKQLFKRLEAGMKDAPGERVWMHCASVGEFEQGRPVLEAIRHQYPDTFIILTFFSPSGYELRKNFAGADLVTYLPLDTPRNAARFMSILQPRLAIIIKYEHWHHHLHALKGRGIPALLVSSIFRPDQPFFRPWGRFWRRMLDCYVQIFVQDERSVELLRGIGLLDRARLAGDTRFDRVCTVADSSAPIESLEHLGDHPVLLVAGSTWPEDERLLSEYFHRHPDVRIIIAPHEITPAHLLSIEQQFPNVIKWSACLDAAEPGFHLEQSGWQTLLIDNIGMLSRLYRYGQVAYIGGGFHRAGIHNVLEAAVYGMPVIFGPEHRKSKEASDLKKIGGAFVIRDSSELEKTMDRLLSKPDFLSSAGKASGSYVRAQAGATNLVMNGVQEYLRSRS
jgi:3-deoxy-D-manno-octulosonic-acid transferase